MIVFGILKRHGRVHTGIVLNAAKKPLQAAKLMAAWPSIASSARTAGGATMVWWIGGTKSISA